MTNSAVIGVPSGQAARLVTYPFSPARARAFVSRARFTLRVPPDSRTNRVRFTAVFPATAFSALVTCSSMPRSGAAGTVGPVLVVDDLIPALVGRPGGPGLSEDVPVEDFGVGVGLAPRLDDVGDVGDPGTPDERQSRGLDGTLVARGH